MNIEQSKDIVPKIECYICGKRLLLRMHIIDGYDLYNFHIQQVKNYVEASREKHKDGD